MRFVWPGPLNFPKVLYYINRYLTAMTLIFATYRELYVFVESQSIEELSLDVAALRPDVSMEVSSLHSDSCNS